MVLSAREGNGVPCLTAAKSASLSVRTVCPCCIYASVAASGTRRARFVRQDNRPPDGLLAAQINGLRGTVRAHDCSAATRALAASPPARAGASECRPSLSHSRATTTWLRGRKVGGHGGLRKLPLGVTWSQPRSFQLGLAGRVLPAGSRPKRGSVMCSSSTKYQPGFPPPLGFAALIGSVISKPKK